MIGAKALGTLVVLAIALAVAVPSGLLRPERVLSMQGDAAFVSGALGAVVALLLFRFLRLSERSGRYFRLADRALWEDEVHFLGTHRRRVVLGANATAQAFDLHPAAQFAACAALGLLLGIATMGSRAMALLVEFPRAVTAAGSTWCSAAPKAEEEEVDVAAPGCALVRRAYELGYAKSLGDCGEKKKKVVKAEVCTLRQLDEPYLHYAYRLLQRFGDGVAERATLDSLGSAAKELDDRMNRIELLYSGQHQVMASAPHAAHHLWTNLPDPGGAFSERTCTERYRELPHRPPTEAASSPGRLFEHVLAQLLFESRYEPAAGYCREYHVHWGAPDDACEQLAANPKRFLAEGGALESVQAALERARVAEESHGENMAALLARALEPQSYLTFACFMEGSTEQRSSMKFRLDGLPLRAEVLTVRPSEARRLNIDRYGQLANLLAPSFHYGALHSQAGVEAGVQDMGAAFGQNDFLFSRLHSLGGLDLFLEPEWIAARTDLLELYPYHLHLKNFVHLFREQYRSQVGRL